jgi:class 3 adenylate cyclase
VWRVVLSCEIDAYRGKLVDFTGDRVLATFDESA